MDDKKAELEWFDKYLVGGVNSPVRNFAKVDLPPLIVKRAKGKYIYDITDRAFVDFCLAWGVFLLGHSDDNVNTQIHKAIETGTTFGFNNIYEAKLAKKIIEDFKGIEKVRFVNSGTEAVMSAIRLARAVTKRDLVVKFDGCYHGHSDFMLVGAGSGVAELPYSSSLGVTKNSIYDTVSLPFNDIGAIEKLFKEKGKEIAAVIVEPIPGNMGLVLPKVEFLSTLRKLCDEYDSLLIFDEVISGYRVGIGGAQKYFDIYSDITILGKVIGGGFPIGAFGAREEIMNYLAPIGDVYQAGTFSGNPIAMVAGLSVLERLNSSIYSSLESMLAYFSKELSKKTGLIVNYIGTMFSIFWKKDGEINNYSDVQSQDRELFLKSYKKLFEHNILLPPSMFETAFVSIKHDYSDFEKIIEILSG